MTCREVSSIELLQHQRAGDACTRGRRHRVFHLWVELIASRVDEVLV